MGSTNDGYEISLKKTLRPQTILQSRHEALSSVIHLDRDGGNDDRCRAETSS